MQNNNTFTHTTHDAESMKRMTLANYEPSPIHAALGLANYEQNIVATATITAKGIFLQEVNREEPLFGTHLREASRALKDLIR
jgi:hypothetical protein